MSILKSNMKLLALKYEREREREREREEKNLSKTFVFQ